MFTLKTICEKIYLYRQLEYVNGYTIVAFLSAGKGYNGISDNPNNTVVNDHRINASKTVQR